MESIADNISSQIHHHIHQHKRRRHHHHCSRREHEKSTTREMKLMHNEEKKIGSGAENCNNGTDSSLSQNDKSLHLDSCKQCTSVQDALQKYESIFKLTKNATLVFRADNLDEPILQLIAQGGNSTNSTCLRYSMFVVDSIHFPCSGTELSCRMWRPVHRVVFDDNGIRISMYNIV